MPEIDDLWKRCDICGGPGDCRCAEIVERIGISETDGTLTVTTPVRNMADTKPTDSVREMLAARGFDPDGWEVRSLTVNDWQTPVGHGSTDVIWLHQTKATLTRIVPADEQPWYRFAAMLSAARPGVERKPRRRLKPEPSPTLVVLMGDDQAPWVNRELHEATCEALADMAPDRFIYMGDGCDFDSISRYDPEHPEWESSVQAGLDVAHRLLAERLDAAGWPDGEYISGNHEHRLQKLLMKRARDLVGLTRAEMPNEPPVLSIPNLLRLDDLGLRYARSPQGEYPHPTVRVADGTDRTPPLVAAHGWVARKGGGSSARATIENLNASVVVGHTHRLALTYLTRWTADDRPVVYAACESGTMANLVGLGYAKFPDWQAGWLTVTVYPDGAYSIEPVIWRDGALRWRDRSWRPTARGVRAS